MLLEIAFNLSIYYFVVYLRPRFSFCFRYVHVSYVAMIYVTAAYGIMFILVSSFVDIIEDLKACETLVK